MIDYIKYCVVALAVGIVYMVGYEHAQYKGELAIEEMKMSHSQAIIDAQAKEKAKYEEAISSLIADLDVLRSQHDSRLRELKDFRARETDNRTCSRQRADLARIAVELERVADRAIVYLEGGRK